MTLKIKKLDKRNNGYGMFEYYVNPRHPPTMNATMNVGRRDDMYHEVRQWCWETWGPSKELGEWANVYAMNRTDSPCQNEFWCWQNDSYARRIFLRTEKELILMKLRWE